jgi:FMN phosphatase YigB (HAD superfamily)
MRNQKLGAFLMDIDTTLVDPLPGEGEWSPHDSFTRLVSWKNRESLEAAAARIRAADAGAGKMEGRLWPFGILPKMGVTVDELWDVLADDAGKHLFMHPDAGLFIRGVKERLPGVKLWTATTNPQMIALAKLSAGGLADRSGSPYFAGARGGEEVYPGGKASPEFYLALLKRAGVSPENAVMIGDNPEADLKLARKAGVQTVFLVRRSQPEDCVSGADGAVYVKRLDLIFELAKECPAVGASCL